MPVVAPHIYHNTKKILHPYQVRFMRKNKLVHSGVFATLDEAKAFRDGFIQAHLINDMVYVSSQSVQSQQQHTPPVSQSL
jgi:hypothetical protein